MNSIQRKIYRKVRQRWIEKKPVRFAIPKFRQGGVSTGIQALIAERIFRNPNRNAAVIAHLDDAAENIFAMTTRYYDNLPEHQQLPRRYASKTEMVFDPPHESRYVVSTARTGDALGKSYTYQYIHGSEAASWSDRGNDARNAWVSIQQTVPRHWDTMVFLESTGNGRDDFFYKRVSRMLQPSYTGLWEVIFLPWYEHEEYELDCRQGFKRSELENVLSETVFEQTGFKIGDEQLEWRRQIIEDECEGDDQLFRRYYPTFLKDCFEQTEHKFFSEQTKTAYRKMAKEPEEVGDITGIPLVKRAKFYPNKTGCIKIWEHPIAGDDYVAFSDVGEGGVKSDYDCAYVLRVKTAEVVAMAYARMDTDEWATLLHLFGEYYNTAHLAVENNASPDTVRLLWRDTKYPNLYWERDPASKARRVVRPGWNTNKRTRKIMLDTIRNLSRKQAYLCYDEGLPDEMDDFVWNERLGRWEAASGKNDDRIMTIAGLLCVAKVEIRERQKKQKEQVELTCIERYHLRKRKRKSRERQMALLSPKGGKGLIIG